MALRSSGFSLVEICLAIGIVASGLLVIVGLLPVGLQSMHDSAVQYGTASIAQQISSELQETPFSGAATDPLALSGTTNYYTQAGALTTGTDTGTNTSPYFLATFATSGGNALPVPGATTASYPSNLQVIKVTLSYPFQAPAASRQTNVLSYIIAKQNSL